MQRARRALPRHRRHQGAVRSSTPRCRTSRSTDDALPEHRGRAAASLRASSLDGVTDPHNLGARTAAAARARARTRWKQMSPQDYRAVGMTATSREGRERRGRDGASWIAVTNSGRQARSRELQQRGVCILGAPTPAARACSTADVIRPGRCAWAPRGQRVRAG